MDEELTNSLISITNAFVSQTKINADLQASIRALIATLADSDPTFQARFQKRLEEEMSRIVQENPAVAELYRIIRR
jgi:hypothetical protein